MAERGVAVLPFIASHPCSGLTPSIAAISPFIGVQDALSAIPVDHLAAAAAAAGDDDEGLAAAGAGTWRMPPPPLCVDILAEYGLAATPVASAIAAEGQ